MPSVSLAVSLALQFSLVWFSRADLSKRYEQNRHGREDELCSLTKVAIIQQIIADIYSY